MCSTALTLPGNTKAVWPSVLQFPAREQLASGATEKPTCPPHTVSRPDVLVWQIGQCLLRAFVSLSTVRECQVLPESVPRGRSKTLGFRPAFTSPCTGLDPRRSSTLCECHIYLKLSNTPWLCPACKLPIQVTLCAATQIASR